MTFDPVTWFELLSDEEWEALIAIPGQRKIIADIFAQKVADKIVTPDDDPLHQCAVCRLGREIGYFKPKPTPPKLAEPEFMQDYDEVTV